MSWTEADAKSYVLSQLGSPRRIVELDQSNISEALKKSIKTYADYKPVLKSGSINVLIGKQKYDFVLLNKPYGKGLLDCMQEPITSPQAVLSEFEYYRLRQPPYVDLSELVTDRLYYKEVGLLTGVGFDWHWDQVNASLIITPNPNRSFKVSYFYNFDPSVIEDIPTRDQNWVVDYMLALCKEMLGRIRGKFKGTGGNELPIDTDSEALLSEAKESIASLVESLKKRGDWTPPIKG